MAGVTEEHIEETSQVPAVPNCRGAGRGRLLRKHLAEGAIGKDRIFSALDCWILISHPTLSPLARPTLVSSLLLPHQACLGKRGHEQHPSPLPAAQGLSGTEGSD